MQKKNRREDQHLPIAVVGGGLAGLTAALVAARAGCRVMLFEKSRTTGGRAASQTKDGFVFNLGSHALYRDGEAYAILRKLGIEPAGKLPPQAGHVYNRGALHAMPLSPWALWRSKLFGSGEKLAYLRTFLKLRTVKPEQFADLTVNQWLDRAVGVAPNRSRLRAILAAFIRLTTYAEAPHLQSAAYALEQARRGLNGGVLYLDEGWQQLVNQVQKRAVAAGVELYAGTPITAITQTPRGVSLQTADGAPIEAATAILAVDPQIAAKLLVETDVQALNAWLPDAPPQRVASLDLGLARPLRHPSPFVLGIDRPLYYSVHSKSAQLAPPGAALIQIARYHVPGIAEPAPQETRTEIETLLNLLDPTWRAAVVHERFLPSVTTAHTVPLPPHLGRSRARPSAPGYAGVYVAGDWVGKTGSLVDTALHSAWEAAEHARNFMFGAKHSMPDTVETWRTPKELEEA